MFIKLSVTHTPHSKLGVTRITDAIETFVNFDLVLRFNYRERDNCTAIRFQDGTMIGVSESPDEIMAKLS